MEFLGSIWRGETTLKKVYWFYGAIGSLFFFFIPTTLLSGAKLFGSTDPAVLALLAVYALGFAPTYIVFISVGIWRSANAYEGNPIWALLAKGSVILGIIDAVMVISKVIN